MPFDRVRYVNVLNPPPFTAENLTAAVRREMPMMEADKLRPAILCWHGYHHEDRDASG